MARLFPLHVACLRQSAGQRDACPLHSITAKAGWLVQSAVLAFAISTERAGPTSAPLVWHGWVQVAELSNLHMLVIHGSVCQPDGFAPLAQLTSLRWLGLEYAQSLPACLDQLTWLEVLIVDNVRAEDAQQTSAALEAAVARLTNLTTLLLCDAPEGGGVPSTLAGLSRLQHCSLGSWRLSWPEQPAALPGGPWLRSLRSLGASFDTLVLSAAQLATAERLQHLCILGTPTGGTPDTCAAFFEWAAQHPPLRRLSFDMEQELSVPAGMFAHVLGLQRARPQLLVDASGAGRSEGFFYDEHFEHFELPS